jgi:hypothetical protein
VGHALLGEQQSLTCLHGAVQLRHLAAGRVPLLHRRLAALLAISQGAAAAEGGNVRKRVCRSANTAAGAGVRRHERHLLLGQHDATFASHTRTCTHDRSCCIATTISS